MISRVVVSPGHGVTCISYRTWVNREARDPSLLISCGDGFLRLFRILPDSSVYLKRKFVVPQTSCLLKSAFCPLMSFLQVWLGGSRDRTSWAMSHIEGALFQLLVWPHEVEPWFHSWYRGRVETLDSIICIKSTLCCYDNS